jgi:hypothetical protein
MNGMPPFPNMQNLIFIMMVNGWGGSRQIIAWLCGPTIGIYLN